MKFNVFGQKIRLIVKSGLIESGARALFLPGESKILIDSTLKGEDYMQTILHEIVHSVIHRVGINQSGVTDGIEEILCESISTALVENFSIKHKKSP